MSELEAKKGEKTPQGGGGSQGQRKRKKRVLRDETRCLGRLPNGRRCEAARLRHSLYCVFHDPEVMERRLRLRESIPYQHPDEVQRLLGEVVERVRGGKLKSREANAIGFLVTLMMQNQPRVRQERDRVEEAQWGAERNAVLDEYFLERMERRAKAEESSD